MKDKREYLGSKFIDSCGYSFILKFYFFDVKNNAQIYNLYFCIWKFEELLPSFVPKSIYLPFVTGDLNHIIKKQNYFFHGR